MSFLFVWVEIGQDRLISCVWPHTHIVCIGSHLQSVDFGLPKTFPREQLRPPLRPWWSHDIVVILCRLGVWIDWHFILFKIKAKGQYWPLTCNTNHDTMFDMQEVRSYFINSLFASVAPTSTCQLSPNGCSSLQSPAAESSEIRQWQWQL